ncbi:MAG TPA: metallophosphoesterase family protein [Bacillota bacterium]|nr:metallophosphoesterase family protein [Bacillota bacterium]
MRFAAIGDIHSNFEALKSVLEDIKLRNVDFILNTGDMVGYAPFPNEVITLIRENHVLSIQGNYDKAIGSRELVCGCDYRDPKQLETAALSVKFTNRMISDENRSYLKNLPGNIRLSGGPKILAVHGSPRRINEYLYEDSREVQEVTQELTEDLLICGHTHIPYYKVINGKHVINVGSVGRPKHGNPHGTYTVVEIIGKEIQVGIIEVPYDVEKTAQAIEADDTLPNEFAQILRCK